MWFIYLILFVVFCCIGYYGLLHLIVFLLPVKTPIPEYKPIPVYPTPKQIPRTEVKQTPKIIDVLPHILLYAPPGSGKTTLGKAFYNELKKIYQKEVKFVYKVAGEVRTGKDIDQLLKNIQTGDIIFIDEIHSLKKGVEEALYAPLQDFIYKPFEDLLEIDGLYLKIKSNGEKTEVKLPRFTMIGATTVAGAIARPLRERFPIEIELERLDLETLAQIAQSFNKIAVSNNFEDYKGQDRAKKIFSLHMSSLNKKPQKMTEEASRLIAKISLQVPRIVTNVTLHSSALAGSKDKQIIELQDVIDTLELIGIDDNGLHPIDRRLVKVLLSRNNRPAGRHSLASMVDCSMEDLDEMVLPRLIFADIIEKDNRQMNLLSKKAIDFYGKMLFPEGLNNNKDLYRAKLIANLNLQVEKLKTGQKITSNEQFKRSMQSIKDTASRENLMWSEELNSFVEKPIESIQEIQAQVEAQVIEDKPITVQGEIWNRFKKQIDFYKETANSGLGLAVQNELRFNGYDFDLNTCEISKKGIKVEIMLTESSTETPTTKTELNHEPNNEADYSTLPEVLQNKIKEKAQLMVQDLAQSNYQKGGLVRDTEGKVIKSYGTTSDYPDWYKALKRGKYDVLDALQSIVDGKPKNGLSQKLIEIIVNFHLKGEIDKQFGKIPVDEEFTKVYQNLKEKK